MKNIIKSFILFGICLAFATKTNAQLASDKPAPVNHVTIAQPAKPVVIQTVSSTPSAAIPNVKNGIKVAEKMPTVNPIASQGKEVIRLTSDSAQRALPPVSLQVSPAKKSE